jgi:hypothetical protein
MILDAIYDIPMAEHVMAAADRREVVQKYYTSFHAVAMLDGVLKPMASPSERVEFVKEILMKSQGLPIEKLYGAKMEAEIKKVSPEK